MQAPWVCSHHHLPPPFGAWERQDAAAPCIVASIQALSNLRRMSSGDSSRGQPLLQPYGTRGIMQQQPRHVTRRLFSVPCRLPASLSAQLCWTVQSACARVHPLSPAGRENPGALSARVSPVGRRFWTFLVGFPAGQIRIGSPMTAGLSCRPCRRVCVSYLYLYLLVCRRLAAFSLV